MVVNTDPKNDIALWARANVPPSISVFADKLDESTVFAGLEELKSQAQVIIVDLEGVASRFNSRAIAKSDLVIIPMQPSVLDARAAKAAISMIHEEEEVLGRNVPAALLLTKTRALGSKAQRGFYQAAKNGGITVIETPLVDRDVYRIMFRDGGDLYTTNTEMAAAGRSGGVRRRYFALLRRIAR